MELDESECEEVEEVTTIVIQAEVGKSEENVSLQDVDYSVEVLDLEEKTCASSDADPTVVVLEFQVEKSIDEVVLGESSPVRAKAVEDKMDTSNVGADDTLKKRKSFDNGDLLEEEKGVMSIEEVKVSSPAKKLREKSGIMLRAYSE